MLRCSQDEKNPGRKNRWLQKNVIQVEKWVEAHNNLLARFAKEGSGAQVILVSDSVLSASVLKILRTKRQFFLKILNILKTFVHQ